MDQHVADAREDRRAYVRTALAAAPRGPAGATFEYSNSGYVLAGAMIEQKLGQPWEAVISRRLFEPLKLATAGFGAPDAGRRDAEPVGHALGAGGVVPLR